MLGLLAYEVRSAQDNLLQTKSMRGRDQNRKKIDSTNCARKKRGRKNGDFTLAAEKGCESGGEGLQIRRRPLVSSAAETALVTSATENADFTRQW
jgi:hypothetical protein